MKRRSMIASLKKIANALDRISKSEGVTYIDESNSQFYRNRIDEVIDGLECEEISKDAFNLLNKKRGAR